MKQLLLSLFCLISFGTLTYSQVTLQGSLKDSNGLPIPNANVVATELETGHYINYDISNDQGDFAIRFKSSQDSIELNISSMGFKAIRKIIKNKTQTLDVVLTEHPTVLKEVILKSNPITQRGDTLVDIFEMAIAIGKMACEED